MSAARRKGSVGVIGAGSWGTALARVLAVAFFLVSLVFVHRSFYGMRIESGISSAGTGRPAAVKA